MVHNPPTRIFAFIAAFLPLVAAAAPPLTTLEYKVVGFSLGVPAGAFCCKKIAPALAVYRRGTQRARRIIRRSGIARALVSGARRIVGEAGKPLLLPPLPLVGDYQLDAIRLVDSAGVTILDGTPATIPVHVFDEVLVSRVTSRPLSLEEIRGKGIVIDESNFRAVEFEVGFVLDGKTIPVKFPVVAPKFDQSTEIIPRAELEAKLAKAQEINDALGGAQLPEALQGARLNIDVRAINFQFVDPGDNDIALKIPPIPALVVIPGNVGFLHQFFSVMIFTENAAPAGSGLVATNIQAQMTLPPGDDHLPGTFDNPGDDPLRMARTGAGAVISTLLPVVKPGGDGVLGTTDDSPRLASGETGQAEFLVEGLQEGLHVMDLKLTADLEGLAAGLVKIEGAAAGSVLVRNPKFSLAFSHPRTTRAGEPYDAFVTVLNTSQVPANLVNVTLRGASISGGHLENSPETVELGTILPGQTASAKYHIRAERTGSITFSNLTTSDDSLVGRFRLSAGIDERGVALSPDAIAPPDFVNDLPRALVDAANRVLGQALSVATAGQLPNGVKGLSKSVVTQKLLELAEAGQRVRYGDPLKHVLTDLLLDWQGARNLSEGFDQIIRTTDAGQEWRDAIMREMELADPLNASARLADRAADLAGRGERWLLGAASDSAFTITGGPDYAGVRGQLGVAPRTDDVVFKWQTASAVPSAELSVLATDETGHATRIAWNVSNVPAGACFLYQPSAGDALLQVDANCDGTIDGTLAGSSVPFTESAPQLIAVAQDISVLAGRPTRMCEHPEFQNYGTVLAVVFSKPMMQEQVNIPEAYTLENGNVAGSVQIQPGGRVALLNMRQPVSALKPRTMTVSGITDPRGNALVDGTRAVLSTLREGISVHGKVVRADGTLAALVPVTLTIFDQEDSGLAGCQTFVVRVSQVFTDGNGAFAFDFVLAGFPYSISATDTSGLSLEAVQLILDSTAGDALSRQKLLELANSPSAQNTLLAAFAVGGLPQAVAAAEGLDRAVLRDSVAFGSARVGSDVPIALRFRGRGTVTGTVFAADGTTPVANAAVNLFPDPDSRELGRGVFSDNSGGFAFNGVPLGTFSVSAATGGGLSRTVADTLDTPGQTKNVPIVLSSAIIARTELHGFVTESDNATPHLGAQVFIGKFSEATGEFGDVVAAVTTNEDGFWSATNIPVRIYDIIAISVDNRRKGERRNIAAVEGAANQVNIALQGFGVVTGRVETSTGAPVANALVAGGEMLVRTNASGSFVLTGVPTGQRSIDAGLERNPAAGIDFPRLGSAQLNVLPGVENFIVVRLTPAARIVGRVLDSDGAPVPHVTVAMPELGGFSYVDADGNGNYEFIGLNLGTYTVSAPAPLTGPGDNSDALLKKIASGNQDQLLAAIGEAFATFTGVNDPLLNGEGAAFNPLTWGFAKTTLSFDGQTAVADIHFLREGTIAGTVINGQGVPIGARVRLTGVGPLTNGDVGFIVRGERDSDPALGTFEFPKQALVGNFGLQAASPFFPTVISLSGQTTNDQPDARNLVLQFPATRDSNGRVTGTVFKPDGTAAGADVNVKISFGNDFIIRTDANGRFDTQIGLPAINSEGRPGVGYSVEASDPATGLRGSATLVVFPGITNNVEVRLLARGAVNVSVNQADGTPAQNAAVEITGGGFPNERFEGTTNTSGQILFTNIFEGPYAACASFNTGTTTITGRVGVNVRGGQTASAIVTLGPTGTIRGVFIARDNITPIGFAQVAVGNLGFATTDNDGKFEIAAIPLGTYRLLSNDPVSGRVASLTVTLAVNNEIRDVRLIEQARGEITGAVVNSFGTGFVPGATVELRVADNLAGPRTVTSGPDGTFHFPGTPAGAFTLEATDVVSGLRGTASAVLPENAVTFALNVQIQQLASLRVTVRRPGGATVATSATVALGGRSADTDANGQVLFSNLPLGDYKLRATSTILAESRSAVAKTVALTAAGPAPDEALELAGVGNVHGQILQGNGVTPAANAQVTLTIGSELFKNDTETRSADGTGNYSFANVPVGEFRITAESQALGASANGAIAGNGDTQTINLTLSQSGNVIGRLVRADGVTVKSGVDVLLTFQSQSGLPGRAVSRTDSQGAFRFTSIPVGSFNLEAIATDVAGIARMTASLTSNGQELDLGNVVLDEDDPRVVSVTPVNTATGVNTQTVVDLLFNEPLKAGSVNDTGIYLRSEHGPVASTLQLLGAPGDGRPRLVRLTPNALLESLTTYEIVVVDGQRTNATGLIVGSGPTDLVDRPLTSPFVARFTTADLRPPQLLSFTPEDGAIQVDTRSVVRLSFDESLQSTGFTIVLTGPGGPIAGTTSLGIDGRVLVFTPNVELPPNAIFSVTVNGVRDLAGNVAQNQPLTRSFATLDTFGPTVAQLRIKGGQLPIGGSTIIVEAVLAAVEPDVRVRFSVDFASIGTTAPNTFEVPLTLPPSGALTVRALAIDRFGNEGSEATLPIAVQQNAPPIVSFTPLQPATGPVFSGSGFNVRVSATDDGGISELRAAAAGAAVRPLQTTTGAPINVSTLVPANAVPGSTVTIIGQAKDNSGTSSGEQSFELTVADGTPPEVTIVSPSANSVVPPPQFALQILSSDNSGVYDLTATLSGTVTGSQTAHVAVAPNESNTRTFNFDITGAPLEGGTFTATVSATDAAGRNRTVPRTFVLPDLKPPRLLTITPTDGVLRQSLWLDGWTLNFDESLDPATLTSSNFTLRDATNSNVAFTIQPLSGSSFVVRPQLPLRPGMLYRLTVKPGLADAAGNLWKDIAGANVPAGGRIFSITTAAITSVLPASQTKIVPGQHIPASVAYEDGLGATDFTFAFAGSPPVAVSAGTTQTQADLALPADATQARVTFAARRSGLPDFVLADATLDLRPRNADDDGDGWLNGFEVDRGMNPFVANPDSEDFDNDGLTNGQERMRGTDPGNNDSDGDTLLDGAEVAAGTNPLDADSDHDNLRDDVDPFPNAPNQPPVANPDSFAVNLGEPRTITIATELLQNDTDPENQALTLVSFSQPVSGGVVTRSNASTLIFTSSAGFSGGTTFTYTIRDPGNLTSTATVSITVGTNNRPIAGPAGIASIALNFDGVDDQMFSSPFVTGVADTFTIEFWAKPTATRDAQAESTSGTSATSGQRYAIYPIHGANFGDQFVHAGVGVSVGTNGVSVGEHGAFYAPCVLNFDTTLSDWTHVAVVYDNRVPRLYLNGTLVRTGLSGPRITHPGTGISEFLPFGAYAGTLDEIRVWSVALSPAQITRQMFARVHPATAGLVAYFAFDENVGDTTHDLSLTNATGTLRSNGAPLTNAWVQSDGPLRDFGQTLVTTEDTAALLTLTGSDPDGNPITFHVTALPLHGKLYRSQGNGTFHDQPQISTVPAVVAGASSANQLIYEPDPQFNGADAFNFVVNDGQLDSVPATVRITVSSVADAPIVQNDEFQDTQGISFTTGNVLANDSDPDADPIAVGQFVATTTGGGSVTSNGNGTFNYTPNPSFFGDDTFTYRATDGTNLSAPATVTIHVAPSNTRVWVNASGGVWSNPANWLNGLLPSQDDIADITLAGTYTVTLDVDPTISQLVMGNSSGTQTLNISSRTLTIRQAGTTTSGAVVSLPSGTLAVNGPMSIVSLTIGGGSLAGSGNVTVSGTFNWSSGTLLAGGELIVANGATANLTGGSNKGINRVLRNRGTINYTGTNLFFNLGAASSGRIENESGATFIVDGDGDFGTSSGGTNAFNNAGNFIKRNTANTFFNGLVPFNNTGTVTIEAGTLEWQGGATQSGTINSAGGLLTLTSGTYTLNAGSLLNQASLTVSGITLNINDAAAVNFSSLSATSSTVNFGVDYAVATLTLNGSDIAGSGNVTVSGTFNWISGVLRAGGELIVANGATANLPGSGSKGINRVLRNRGTINYTGTNLFFNLGAASSGRIENESGATFIVDGDGDFGTSSGGTNAFNNAGNFIKRNTANTFFNGLVPFNNTGTVTIEAGTLEWQGGATQSGTINSAGGLLTLTSGTYTLNAGSLLNQASLSVSGITLNINDAAAVNFSSLSATSSTVNFGVDYTVATLTLNASDIAGSGNVTVSGTFNWISGTLRGGELIVSSGATANFTGGGNKGINRVLRNRGTINYTGTNLFFNLGAASSGRIENESGATFIADGDGDFNTSSGGTNAFNNAGNFIKRNTANTFFNGLVPFNNTGTVTIEAGTLEWRGGATQNGTIDSAGGLLTLTSGTYTLNAGSLLNQASLTVSGITLNINDAAAVNFSSLSATSSTVNFGVDYTVATLTLNASDIAGSGNVTVSGTFNWISGVLRAGGELIVANGATANLPGSGSKGINRVLRNRGTINYTGTNLFFNLGAASSGRIENESGATFIVDGDGDFITSSGGTNAFNNAGSFIKRNTANTFFNSAVPFNNTGTVTIEAGMLEFQAAFTQTAGTLTLAGGAITTTPTLAVQGGTIAGTGTISGNVSNGGTLAPTGTGTIAITGAYTQTASGTLAIQLGGTAVGAFDALAVGGAATLDGTLAVSLVNGFTLANNESFPVLTFGSRAGDFATNSGLTQGGITLSKNYSATALTLTTPSSGAGALFVTESQIPRSVDTDGDGSSDADEMLAGTDPNDPLSALRIRDVSRDGDDVHILFSSVAGHTYSVEYSETVAPASWNVLVEGVSGTGDDVTIIDRGAAKLERRFYRLRVGPVTGAVSGFLQVPLAGRRTPVSSPFDRAPVTGGRVTAIGPTTLLDSQASWPAGEFTDVAHTVRVRTRDGWLDLPIAAHTANELTVTLRAPNLDDLVRPGDSYQIARMATLSEFMLVSTHQGSSAIHQLRRLEIWNDLGLDRFHYDGGHWRVSGDDAAQDSVPIAPAEGVLIARQNAQPATIWFSGEVHLPRHPAELALRGLGFAGTHIPRDITLGELGLPHTALWLSSRRITGADLLRVWIDNRFRSHFFNGESWRAGGSLLPRDSQRLPAGSAFLIEPRAP